MEHNIMGTSQSARRGWALPFFAVWGAQVFSLFGSQLVQFALIWWLTATTGSATVLATATLVGMLPTVLIGPFAGACVDRWNRRLTMMWADGLIALATAVLAGLYLAGAVQIWHVYALLFVRATAGGFHWPAMSASTTLMVPKEHLGRVAGLNQTLMGAVNIVTPPLGALLLTALPLHGILMIDILTAAIAITPLFRVRIPQPQRSADRGATAEPGAASSVLQDLREGLRYVRSWPALMALLAIATLVNVMIAPTSSLMPLLVTRHFGGGALQLGWLQSALGVGIVVGGLILSAWGGFRRKALTMGAGLLVMSLATTGIGLTPAGHFGLALAMIFVLGMMLACIDGPFMALMQERVAPDMQGRVLTLSVSMCHGLAPLSMAVAGPVADAAGVQTWYVLAGAVCIVIALVTLMLPVLRDLEAGPAGQSAATSEAAPAVAQPSAT